MNSQLQQYQQYPSSSQKNQAEINSQPIQLPSKIHYHSRQNSPTNLTNLLGLSSKAEQFNTNNLYEYTDSNYNPLQDSPFINFSQLEPTPSSGQKSIMKVNSKILDPVYKGQQYELKLDSDKQISATNQLQNITKPNIFVTQEYLENDKLAPTKKDFDISGFQIKSQQISPNSVKQNQQAAYSNNQYFTSANKNDTLQQNNQQDERRVLDFSDRLNSTGKKITQIRSPALTQKTKPQLGFNQSNFKTPQTEQSEQKQNQGGSVEKNTTPANKTFEDTPEIIKISKNVLQPQFPASYSYSSLNNPASLKIKKPSPKNMQANQSILQPSQQQQQQLLQQQNNESQISQFESINLNQPRGNNTSSNIKKYSYETKNSNGSRYISEKRSANFPQIDIEHMDKYSQPSIQNSLQNISISQNQSQQQSASSQKQQKYSQENKYSSLYKVKSSSNNFNNQNNYNEPISNKVHNQNNFHQFKKVKDPYNNYYDSRPIIPSSDLNNLSDISEQVSKQTPSKVAGYHSAINQNLNQSDIKKMQEFPQKKRELLEQQRQLLQKEREILEREKELIEQEEEIFYETSQGQLTQMSPSRSSNNPLNMATTPKDKTLDLQNYMNTQPYQSNFYLDDKNYSQQQQYESVKSSKKSQQNTQAFTGTDKIYEKTIRDSQNVNSQYKLGFMNNSSQAPEEQKQTLNQTEQTNKISADKKTNPFYYTLNSLHASKNSQPTQQFQYIDQFQQQKAMQISQEQNFQRKKSDLEQSFHTNMNAEEERNVKDIVNYFKTDQEKTKKSSHNDQSNNINNPYNNKIIQLPLSMKKELSQKNKQPQITNQSPPERTEETLILELMTPQKNNEQNELMAKNLNPPQPFQIDTNNPNAYYIKKQKIFSPNSQKNRSSTPQTYFSKNNYNIKISPNYHEFGIQVDENSFYDRASFINKNSPKSDVNTKKTMTVSDIKSIPISAIDKGSMVQGQSNFSSPIMKFQYQNDASTNDFVDSNQPINLSSYIVSNKQSIQKGDPQVNDRYRSVSQIQQPQNNLQSSIEYVYGNKNANKKQKNDLLCFGCGDTQTSTENNIIIESDQLHHQINNQNQDPIQQKQTSQFHTFQTQPQEIAYPLSKSYQPTQNNHINKQMQDQFIPEQTVQSTLINFKTQEDQKANPPLLTQLTFNQDSIRSPYFRDEREEQVKRANISPQKIFYQRPNASKSPIQYSVEKVSYDPTDYKNNNNQSHDFHRNHINNPVYPIQNSGANNISNPNLNNNLQTQAEKQENAPPFFNPSNNNSFLSNIPKSTQQKNNEKLDFSYINGIQNNTSGVFHLDSQELFCDKCLEFITQSRFQNHYNVCTEMSQFKFLDKKKQMELINQKILKIAYLVKRKNCCTSPLKGKLQSQSPNQRTFANPNSQQQQQQKENNDQTKLRNYCNYLNECLCDLSHKTITYQDFLQGKEDLQLIIQRIKSIRDNHNMSYYGEMASDILTIKNNLMMQNPI
ncbi:hypothetical protein TTHERM_00711830 (macronuclear) [Tetrahymena thermophila SB210]|uniref:Uncharacterized protein n=1 Tax=Tetrahymena thermophila (strain SB210) TaxID=312017 RepID=Q24D10_TETTS|nr:hypothetical protein TTHERM_00711830 [Tetrahymena thermophila SB210]EAS05598.2 hypothetical protein TTHERM_00711830 [Tetrahymena thermophila SB210]|eukprot:XP_001025843.2 hypothetical protein TTHERM_00711830 [Tetrahymena thermophila SB210]